MLPNGVFAAVLTPLQDELNIDHELFAEHCHWLLANGCDGVAPMGTTGEANSFTVAERKEALNGLLDAGIPPEKILLGVGCCAIPDTVALIRHAVLQNVVSVLALPPFYYKNVSDEGLFAAYDQVIQHVAESRLQLYLYHFPQMSGVPLSHDLIARLIDRYPKTVVGMKDSSGDWNNMKTICERFPGFRIYAGSEKFLFPIVRAGGVGCISATTNLTCNLAAKVYACRANDEAEVLQRQLSAAREALEAFPAIPALKHMVAKRTGKAEWRNVRPPHLPLPQQSVDALEKILAERGFPVT